MAGELDGKVALVTGAAGGIGRATALMFAAMGADMILLDLKADAIREAEGAIEKGERCVHAITTDIRERDAVKAAIGEVETALGGVSILVNNAGVGLGGPGEFENIEDADLDWMFAVTQAVVRA